MKRIVLTAFISTLLFPLFAQTTFHEANTMYAEGNYADAIAAYEYILQEQPSAELYYNLGNAYFKQNELALAIVNYERALRLRPYYADARYNLKIAQSRIIDNIEEKDSFFLSQWIADLRDLASEQTWVICSICLFSIVIACVVLFLLADSAAGRRAGFYIGVVALLFTFTTLCFSYSLHQRDIEREDAIVVQGMVNVKASPDKSGTELFSLHEGTKVKIRSTLSDWAEITVGNYRGWVRLNVLERI